MSEPRELTAVERLALKLRHEAAVDVLRDSEADPRELLEAIVAPSDELRKASERRARELLLERAAAA